MLNPWLVGAVVVLVVAALVLREVVLAKRRGDASSWRNPRFVLLAIGVAILGLGAGLLSGAGHH